MRLTAKESEVIERLIATGLPKNVAKSLTVIFRETETKSVEIEQATGLRQPEVSIAMQHLRKAGWIKKRDIKKEGKGRPTHAYTLRKSKLAIFEELDKSENKKIKDIEKNMVALKKLMS